MNMSPLSIIAAIILLVVSFVLYFLPTLVADSRKHPNATSIFVLNLLLGWTVIGWVGSLVWAYSKISEVQTANDGMKKCPYCAEPIKTEAIKCKHCGSDLTKPAAAAIPQVMRSGRG